MALPVSPEPELSQPEQQLEVPVQGNAKGSACAWVATGSAEDSWAWDDSRENKPEAPCLLNDTDHRIQSKVFSHKRM